MQPNNADLPASPSKISINRYNGFPGPFQFENNGFESPGLTKREMLAAMAMQGMMSNGWKVDDHMATEAVSAADLLLLKLDIAPDA